MSHYSKVFNKVPVQIPNRSGFDLSHENLFTAKCGTLYPVLVDTIIPGDSFSLGQSSQIQLPPMATDFYGRVMGKFEAFFVPFRILYGGWQELITHPVSGDNYPSGTPVGAMARYLPTLVFPKSACLAGSLADFLGRRSDSVSSDTSDTKENFRNPLPFLAYHKIWQDWYRDSRIQAPAFSKFISGVTGFQYLPYITKYGEAPYSFNNIDCADGVPAYQLRQRNWEKDYFTNATPKPQAGDPAQLAFDVSDGKRALTI